MKTTIRIDAWGNNKIIGTRIIENQLNTDQWGNMLALLLGYELFPTGTQLSTKDITGASRALAAGGGGSFKTIAQNDGGDRGPYFQLGTGVTPAAISDYVLETPIAGTASLLFTYLTGSGVVSAGATINYGSPQAPTELGLVMNMDYAIGVAAFLIDHAVFAALPAANVFTVSYAITLA